MRLNDLIRSCQQFPAVIPVPQVSSLRVTHPSAMVTMVQAPLPHRLACVKHSVSVHPEPGSNSSFNYFFSPYFLSYYLSMLFPSYFLPLLYMSSIVLSTTPAVDKNYSIKFYFLCQQVFSIFLNFFSFYFLPQFFQHLKTQKFHCNY